MWAYITPGSHPLLSVTATSAAPFSHERLQVCLYFNFNDNNDDQGLQLIVADIIVAVIPMDSMIYFEKQRKIFDEQMMKEKKELNALQKCLNSPRFLSNAAPAVMQQIRSSAVELGAQLSSLTPR